MIEPPAPELLILDAAEHTELIVDIDEPSQVLLTERVSTEIVEYTEQFNVVEVAEQGLPGPIGPIGATGVTIFTDISAAAVSGINDRLALLDQFTASITDTGESSNFLAVYQLHL